MPGTESSDGGPVGTARIRPGAEPRNHHGDAVAPPTPEGRPYRYAWADDNGDTVYAETGDHLINVWIPGYLDSTTEEQARIRAEHAVRARTEIVATIAADVPAGVLSESEEAILLADLSNMPDLDRWSSEIPLVLLEGMYRPFTDRLPPVSAIDGDVRDPSNILWLRHSSGNSYVESLAHAGYITLDVRQD